MGLLLQQPLFEMAYAQRLPVILGNGIGLWDVLQQCERAGALDSAIRNAVNNDFKRVTRVAPSLQRVCFNGKAAGRFAPVFSAVGYETLVLPSSSPAYTLSLGEKLKAWRGVIAPCKG